MDEKPLKVMDGVVGLLADFGGQVAYNAEITRRGKLAETAVLAASTTIRCKRELFKLTGPRDGYPIEVWADKQMIASGYRRCDSSRQLKSCLLSLFRRPLVRAKVAEVLEVQSVETLFKPKG